MEASSNRFHKWESNFIKTIESKRPIGREDELDFKDYIRNIESTNSLPAPYEDQTYNFLNVFSPQIINTILETRSLSIESEISYETILRQYSQILGQQLTINKNVNDDTDVDDPNSNEKFVQAASKIIEIKNSNFYLISEKNKTSNVKNSENYNSNCHAFATTTNLELFIDFFQSPTMKSLSKIEHIIKMLLPISHLFDSEKMNSFIQVSTLEIWDLISNQNPRKLNISEIETALSSLEKMTKTKSIKLVVWKVQISFAIKILKSGILTNQLSSLSTICRICKESPEIISPILRDENIIDYLLYPEKNSSIYKTSKEANQNIEKVDEKETTKNDENETNKNDENETNKNNENETNQNNENETNKNNENETNKNNENETNKNNENETNKNNENETNKNNENETNKNNENETNKNNENETNKNNENETNQNNENETNQNNENETNQNNENEINKNDENKINKNDENEANKNNEDETNKNNENENTKNNNDSTKGVSLKRKQSFIGDDIHFELITYISDIFASMYNYNCANDSQLKTLWLKSISQSQTTIGTFLKSMENILSQIPKEPFFNMIIETNRFPESIFPFLQKISSQCPPQSKPAIFNELHELYFSEENSNEETENVLIQTMLNYILDSDPTFCNKLQIECINFIKSDQHIKYSLKILQNALFFMTSNKAHEAFEIIMNKIDNDSIEYLDLLANIMKKFDSQIKQDDFISLQEKVTKMITEHSKDVCGFYQILIDSKDQKPVFSNETILEIYNHFCSLQYNENVFEMIKKLYQLLNNLSLKNEKQEQIEIIDSIWNHLFETNRQEVSSFLISIYVNSNDHNKAQKFIGNCLKNLHCIGSLEAIKNIIHVMEDGIQIDENHQQNRILFSFDFVNVNLLYLKNKPCQIKVTKDISYEGFKRTVIKTLNLNQKEQNPSNVLLYNKSILFNHDNFNLYDNINVSVRVDEKNTKYRDIINIKVNNEYIFPSEVLLQEKYFTPIFDIMLENDQNLSPIALNIFNLIPTLPTQISEINSIISSLKEEEQTSSQKVFETFLSVKHPYLLSYRIYIIGNIELKDSKSNDEKAEFQKINCHDFLNYFYKSGGIELLLNTIFNIKSSSSLTLPNDGCINDLLRVTKLLLLDKNFVDDIKNSIEKVKENIQSFLQWTIEIANSNDDSLLADITLFMKELSDYIYDFDEFSEIVKLTIFHKLPVIRLNSYEIANSIDSVSMKEKLIVPLLKDLAKTSKCSEYFNLMINIAQTTETPFNLYETVIDALYVNYTIPENATTLEKLMFIQPPANYSNGLFKTMNILIERLMKNNENDAEVKADDAEKLFKFLTNQIIFNPYKYYQPSDDLFSAYLILLDKYDQFLNFLEPIVKVVEDFKLSQKSNSILSSTARNRGIKNLGATCYMNSTIQQLFNIREFSSKILSAKSNEEDNNQDNKDWFFELQYDFAKLWLFPLNFINISNFVKCWKGYDGEPINIHQQQDSAEFLQLLIDRLEQKIPGITSIFTGKIEHCTVGAKVQYENKNYETFDIFPLEVKNHMKTSESLRTFLRPDRFECNDDELGKFDALRYHHIVEAPKILIIQLKRFNYNLTTMEREKINSFYTFTLELDLSTVMKNEDKKVIYDLCGVVQHTGSANSGHYFSDVQRETGKWFCLNDNKCTKINGDDLPIEAAGGKEEKVVYNEKTKTSQLVTVDKSTNAYLLFYRLREEGEQTNKIDKNPIELDERVMNRLLPAIQKSIFEAACSTPQFSQIVLKICQNGEKIEFLYKYALNSMRVSIDQLITETLVTKCINTCNSNQQFCDFILKRETDFYEFIILMKFTTIRKYFVSIIEAAIKNCSNETKIQFYNYLFNQISSSSQIIYENRLCIPEFFKIVILTVGDSKEINKKELLKELLNFVVDSIQLYDSKHKSEKIFYSINLSNALDLMTNLCKEIKEKEEIESIKLSIASKMFQSPIFTSLTVSQIHSKNLASLLEFILLSNNKTKKLFHSYLDKKIKTIPVPSVSLFLNLSMTISDQDLIDRFFNIITTKSYSEIVLFFHSLEPLSHSNRNIFMFNAQLWIKSFLLSSNISVRAALVIFIYKMFPDVDTENKNEIENDKGVIINIYQNLIDSVPFLIQKITKLKKNSQNVQINDDNIPTQEFFEILTWSVEKVQIKDRKDIQIFVSLLQTLDELLRNVPNVTASVFQFHCLQYLVKIYGKQLFLSTQPSNIITPLNNSIKSTININQRTEEVVSMINNLLIKILPQFCICYLKSKLFFILLMYSFNTEASKFVDENLNKETVRLITTVLWNQNVLKRNCYSYENNLLYLQTSWKIIKVYNETCDIIYDQQDYVILLNLINKNSPIQRTAAKFLAEFNIAYEVVNRNKKHFLTLKTQTLYSKYKENGFKWDLIYEAMYNNRNMISPGNGGLCHFSRSMIYLKKNPPQTLLSLISKSPKPFITTVLPTVSAAKLVCDLCVAFPDSGEAINCLIREFSSINTCYKVVEIFCQSFAKMKRKNFWLDLQKPLKEIFLKSDDIDVAGYTVLRMSEQLFDKETLIQFRNKIVTLMSVDVRKVINELSDSNYKIIQKEYTRLCHGFEFVHDITSTLGDREPLLDISKEESQKFIEILKSNRIAKASDSFFLYISKKL